jgi:hypothetical protein
MSARFGLFVEMFSWLFMMALIAATITAMFGWRYRAALAPAGRASDGGFQPIAPATMVATAPKTPSQHKDTITSSIVAFIIPPAPKVGADETTNAGDDCAIVRIAEVSLARECFHLMAWPKRAGTAFLEGSWAWSRIALAGARL